MADTQGGLMGMDPSLLLNLGLGLLSAGGKNLAGQGNVGQALMGGLNNYYSQQQAKGDLQSRAIANQGAAMQNAIMQAAAERYLRPGQQPQGLFGPTSGTPDQSAPPPGIAAPGLMGPTPSSASPDPGAPPPGIAASMPSTPSTSAPFAYQMPGMPQLSAGIAPTTSTQSAPTTPSWLLTPPTPAQLRQSPIGGLDPDYYRLVAIAQKKDPLTADKEIEDRQRANLQEQYSPLIGKLETIIKSDRPQQYLSNDPQLQQIWNQAASKLGLTKPSDFTDQNVRTALTYARNGIASSIGLPTIAPTVPLQTVTLKDGRIAQIDPVTNKETIEQAGPDIITADQRAHLSIDQQRLADEQQKTKFEQSRKGIPAGYELDPDASSPTAVRPIVGGPADPDGPGGGMGNRAEVTFNRIVSAGNSAVESLKNISELPMGASTGLFGVGGSNGHGILSTLKGNLVTKLQPQEVQDYNTMIAGLGRNLATLETQGLAPGGGFTKSMERLEAQAGDSQITILRKQAEARQIIETNLQASLANPKVPVKQKQFVSDILDKVKTAIPYSNHDVTQLEQSKDPKKTIMDFAAASGLTGNAPTGAATASPSNTNLPRSNSRGWLLHTDANGNMAYVSGDGKQYQAVKP